MDWKYNNYATVIIITLSIPVNNLVVNQTNKKTK